MNQSRTVFLYSTRRLNGLGFEKRLKFGDGGPPELVNRLRIRLENARAGMAHIAPLRSQIRAAVWICWRSSVPSPSSVSFLPDRLESVGAYQFGPDDIATAFFNISNAPAFFGLRASERL